MRLITKNNAMNNAFTLAEVLITLAIIGVVAAMTMPTLISNTNGAQFKTAYKKALSVLSQAVVMNIALDEYDLAGTSENADGEDNITPSLYKMFSDRTNGALLSDTEVETYSDGLSETLKLTSETAGESGGSPTTNVDNYVFRFHDGIIFTFEKDAASCTEADPCKGFIDTNGTKGPNKLVECTNSDGDCTSKVTINDIFPIKFYDQTVAPNSPAARAVLYGSENNEQGTETNPSGGTGS